MNIRAGLKLSHKGFVLIAVPLVFEILFLTMLGFTIDLAERETEEAESSAAIVNHANKLESLYFDAINSLTESGLKHNSQLIDQYDRDVIEISDVMRSFLKSMEKRPHEQLLTVEKMGVLGDQVIEMLDEVKVKMEKGSDLYEFQLKLPAAVALTKKLVSELKSFISKEEQSRRLKPDTVPALRRLIKGLVVAGVLLTIFMAVALAIFFNRGTTARLQVLMDNTFRLAHQQPLNVPLTGGDELAHLDNTFHEMAEALDEAARKKQEVVAMVSHDLRSPLGAINNFLTMLGSGKIGTLNEMGDKLSKAATRSSHRMLALINDLLDLERLEAGEMPMEFANVALSDVFERAIDSTGTTAQAQGVKLETDGAGVETYADGDRIVQVLVNLIANAVKYSPPDGVVSLTARQLPDCVEVRVSDQGRGIPPHLLDSVFGRFQQVEVADAKKKGGTGLGLAICKAIVEQHHGSIGVESTEGKGSTFWFRLPVKKTAVAT